MTKKTHLQIRLSEDEKARLVELADQKRLTLSAYAREKLLGGSGVGVPYAPDVESPDEEAIKRSRKVAAEGKAVLEDRIAKVNGAPFRCPRCSRRLGSSAAVCAVHGRKAVPV